MALRKKQAENDEIFMGFTAPHTGKDKKTIPSHIKTVTFEPDKKQMKTFERRINHFNKRFYDLYSSSYGGENDKYDVAAGAKYTKGYFESLSTFCNNTPLDKFREYIGEKLTAVICAKDAVKYGVPSRIIDFMQPVIKHMPENIQSKAMEIEAKGRIPLNEESAAMTKLAFDAKYYNELRDPKKSVGAKERYQEAIENLRCAMVADEVDFNKASAVMCEQMTTYMKNDKNGVMQRRYGGFLSGEMLISEGKDGIKFVEPDPANKNKFKEVDLFRDDLVREPAGNMKDLFELHKNGMKKMFDAAGHTRSDSISLGKGKNLKAMCKQTYAMYKDDLAIIKQDSENKKVNVSEFKKQFKAYTGSLIYDYLKDDVKVNDKFIPSFIRKCKETYDSKYKDMFEGTNEENITKNTAETEGPGVSLTINKDEAQKDQSSDEITGQPEDIETNMDTFDSSDAEKSAQAEFMADQTKPTESKVEDQNFRKNNIEPVGQQTQSEGVETTDFESNTIGGPTSKMNDLIGEQAKQDVEKTEQVAEVDEQTENKKSVMSSSGDAVGQLNIESENENTTGTEGVIHSDDSKRTSNSHFSLRPQGMSNNAQSGKTDSSDKKDINKTEDGSKNKTVKAKVCDLLETVGEKFETVGENVSKIFNQNSSESVSIDYQVMLKGLEKAQAQVDKGLGKVNHIAHKLASAVFGETQRLREDLSLEKGI